MDNSEILDEKVGLTVNGNFLSSDSFKESDHTASDSALYEKFILDIDSYWDELNDRLNVSRMVSDSVVKGMVNAIVEEANEKIALKDLEIAVLNKKLESCNSNVVLVPNSVPITMLNQSSMTESEISDRLKSCESYSSAHGDFKFSDSFSQLRMLSEFQWEDGLQSQVASIVLQDFIRDLQDQYETKLYNQTLSIKALDKKGQDRVSELSTLRGELHAILEELNNHDNFEEWSVAKRKEHFPSKLVQNHMVPSEVEENGIFLMDRSGEFGEHMLDIADLPQLKHMNKEELLAYCKNEMVNMSRRHDSALQEKTEELFRLKRKFLKEMGSSPFRKDKEIEHLRKKLPEFITKLDEILKEFKKPRPMDNHDDELQNFKERIQNLFSENNHMQSLLMKKTNELKYLSAEISDAENQASLHSSMEANYFRQIRKLESDLEDVQMEAKIRDSLCSTILRGFIHECNHTMKDTENEIHSTIEIYTTIFRVVISEVISSMNHAVSQYFEEKVSLGAMALEKEKALKLEMEENQKLKQLASSNSLLAKEKEKLASEAGSAVMLQKQQLDFAKQELDMLRNRIHMQELQISDYVKESTSLNCKLNEALQKICYNELETNKVKENLRDVSDALKEAEKQKAMLLSVLEEKQKKLSSFLQEDREHVKQLATIDTFMSVISKSFEGLERRLTESSNKNGTRLKVLDHQLKLLLQLSKQQEKKCSWYQNILEMRCSDLQKAEAEVDILADEVEVLIGLLGKIYLALDHYSPVLEHYPGVMEILKLIRMELNGENN
ncbi:WPP domain-associated protein-like isoform X1 [Zingiber officinale]|uniref:WPP domain-associated protein-like isoform X1 n=1 Tax=Zingiber officinale TaxID=94328 RepID=UPI001C4C81DE|nr:WPP domain-associated protein-like isoform X1 [Zingiber officinale]